jgi:hypothetical protein
MLNKYSRKLLVALLIVTAFFAFLAISTRNVTAETTTGDANSFSCSENLVNTYTNYLPWFNENCITPTPTPTCNNDNIPCVTPTPTIDPCGDNGERCITPTVTPIPTTAPSNPGGSGDGKSDGRSDGLSSCPSCTQAHNNPTQAVLGASTGPIQAVLGLSTTSGEESALPVVLQIFGALTSAGLGFVFLKKNA